MILHQGEAESGGYGNFTCLDHGGGLSDLLRPPVGLRGQPGPERLARATIIGYVGCTGHCFGDHLHFEVRVNGAPTDPLGYL